jgi:hypothetical protein
MYIKSREELELFAESYALRPPLRRGIRLTLNVNTADILLVIYWGQGKTETSRVLERIMGRENGRNLLTTACHELLEFSHFDDWEVRIACENTAYLIAVALDRDWDSEEEQI